MRGDRLRAIFIKLAANIERQQFSYGFTIHDCSFFPSCCRQEILIFFRAELIWDRTVVALDFKIRATSSVESPSISRSTIATRSLYERAVSAVVIRSRSWLRWTISSTARWSEPT